MEERVKKESGQRKDRSKTLNFKEEKACHSELEWK